MTNPAYDVVVIICDKIVYAAQNDSLATLLARLEGILGPLPQHMVRKGRFSHRFYTRQGVIYERFQRTVDSPSSFDFVDELLHGILYRSSKHAPSCLRHFI